MELAKKNDSGDAVFHISKLQKLDNGKLLRLNIKTIIPDVALDAYIGSVKTIVALKKYQLKTGDLPNHLRELVPDYLREMPVDPFNGKPL